MASWRIIKEKQTAEGKIRILGLPAQSKNKKYIVDKLYNGISFYIGHTDTLAQANKIYNTISQQKENKRK